MRAILLSSLALVPSLLPAQRPDATFEWQKRSTAIRYGAVPVGKHSLAELAIGASWRLGNNEASTWQVGMPLLAGEHWIAPGEYRVTFHRTGETAGTLVADGSGQALVGTADAEITGEIETAGKESKKLVVEWNKDGAGSTGNQPARLAVQFGSTQWRGSLLVLGHKEHKIAGGKLLAFHVPAEHLDKGAVPVATLSKGKDGDKGTWNLVLSGKTARLVPWMKAPTDSFGFGEVVPPVATLQSEGTVTDLEGEAAAEVPLLTVRDARLAKGELRLVATYGKKSIEIVVPEPGEAGAGGKGK
jgi:hypothetical protein